MRRELKQALALVDVILEVQLAYEEQAVQNCCVLQLHLQWSM